MQRSDLPKEIPYGGWVSPDTLFFFRPRMQEQPELAHELTGPNRQLEQWFKPEPGVKCALEYCSGVGHWIVEQASRKRDWHWIALEKRFDRAKRIAKKIEAEKLSNVSIACTEAKWFTQTFLPTASHDAIFINFPDPWPRERHQHHRLFEPTFIEQMIRIMKEGATLELVTDDLDYIERAIDVLLTYNELIPAMAWPTYREEIEMKQWGYSYFAELWISKGRALYRTQFIKQHGAIEPETNIKAAKEE